MGFLDFFRRPPPIRDAAALADFIDRNAAFVVQKGIYEYSRARAGHYAKVLFREPEFQAAVRRLALAGLSARACDGGRDGRGRAAAAAAATTAGSVEALVALVLGDFRPLSGAGGARRTRPGASCAPSWTAGCKLIGLHPPKWAKDVPEQFAESYFDLMPIHEKLRGRDFPTTRNYLRVTMTNIHDELTKRLDAPATARIPARRGPVAAN